MNTLPRAQQLQDRTKNFALRVITAFSRLPKGDVERVIGRQFLRSGTSLAANYRAACRARSAAEFISKLGTVTEEADETLFWFELLKESELINSELVQPLMSECEELVKIFSKSVATAKQRRVATHQITESLTR